MFLFSVTLQKLHSFKPLLPHTHMKILQWTALLLLPPQWLIHAGTVENECVKMTSVLNNHIKFHKNQAIKICNSDFHNW